MTLVISADWAVVSNTETLEDGPAVRITGANVHLTNTEAGRIISDTPGEPALAIEAAGATVINELGGIIRASLGHVVIAGSAGADTIVNHGLIVGIVSLGGGRDSYTTSQDYFTTVDLGGGGDRFVAEGTADYYIQPVVGGAGSDVFTIAGRFGVINGQNVTGFERLVIEREAGNIVGFSGFGTIVIRPIDPGEGFVFKNFVDCHNPDADLAFSNQSVTVNGGSTFRHVTGGSGSEGLEVLGTVLGDIDLGGGDDGLTLRYDNGADAQIGGSVDGGEGTNTIGLDADDGRTVDLAAFSRFTRLFTGVSAGDEANVRVRNADGFETIQVQHGHLTIAATEAPNAGLLLAPGASARLAGDSVIGSVGWLYPGLDTTAQGNDLMSFAFENDGEVLGNVWLDIGDDLYDGRSGVVGGTVFGFAGNDELLGGAGDDRLDGGHGADRLAGGDGADALAGGQGGDSLNGGARRDTLDGGVGADVLVGGTGGDTLTGGADKDRLTGGAGLDRFVFAEGDLSAGRAATDVVTDFSQAEGDRLDLSGLDADVALDGDQKFVFIGAAGFSGAAGELRFVQAGSTTFVEGDTDGDGTADLAIKLLGPIHLAAQDFVL